jgi:hypothetical protein
MGFAARSLTAMICADRFPVVDVALMPRTTMYEEQKEGRDSIAEARRHLHGSYL